MALSKQKIDFMKACLEFLSLENIQTEEFELLPNLDALEAAIFIHKNNYACVLEETETGPVVHVSDIQACDDIDSFEGINDFRNWLYEELLRRSAA